MGMQTDHDTVAPRKVSTKPLDLIRINIRCRHFNRARQIDDHRILGRRPPGIRHGGANLGGKVQLSAGKAFWRIFKGYIGRKTL